MSQRGYTAFLRETPEIVLLHTHTCSHNIHMCVHIRSKKVSTALKEETGNRKEKTVLEPLLWVCQMDEPGPGAGDEC